MPPPKKQSSVQLARPAYAGRTTSTSRPVPLRGTPVRGTPVRGTPVQVGSSSKSKAHTCPICMHPIVETTADAEGQDAILCEGNCSSWYHRWCAGVTALRYEELSDSDEPFHCPTCTAKEQQQTISELQHSVQSLQEEVREMKIAINALQEKGAANAPSLSEDVSELKAMVASLQVPRAERPAASELPDNTPTWTEVARRKPHHSGGKGKGERGKNGKGGSGQGGSGQGGTKQPKERGVPNHRGPSTNQTKGKDSQHQSHQFRSLPGKRKVWGTRKACSSDTVKDTISKLVSAKVTIEVKSTSLSMETRQ